MAAHLKAVLIRNLRTALGRGDHAEAAVVLEKLKEEDPLSVETRGLELECLIRAGRHAEAGALTPQLLALFPASARIRFLAGQLAYRQKNYAAAEAHLRESHRLFPHWRTHHLTGKTLTQQGRLDEAEAILAPLADAHPHVALDLAWLYERKGDLERARAEIERFLAVYPDNAFARSQRVRLRARVLAPEELLQEVDALRDLGEEVPEDLLPHYVESLLRRGQGPTARAYLAERRARLGPRAATRTGWACYKLQAFDLALDLFRAAFAENRTDYKFLAALEKAADRCGRLAHLVPLYEAHAPEAPRLYGRLKTLRRRLDAEG